jgi:hypothetical protein
MLEVVWVPPGLAVVCGVMREVMDNQGKQKRAYKILAVLLFIAGTVRIVYGFVSPRFILYPFIGLANLGIAYVCKQLSA